MPPALADALRPLIDGLSAWHGLLLLGTAVWAWWAAPDAGARRAIQGAVPVAVLVAWGASQLDPATWSVAQLQPVREGPPLDTLSLSWASNTYGLRSTWQPWLRASALSRLDAAVTMSVALGAATAAVLAAWVRWRTDSRVATAVIAAAFVLTPIGRVAVMSGDLGPFLWPGLLAGLAACAGAQGGTRPAVRASGAVLAGIWFVWLGWQRAELWAIPAVALGVTLVRAMVGEIDTTRPQVRWALGGVGAAVLALACVPQGWMDRIASPMGDLAVAVHLLHPAEGSVAWLVPFWMAAASPGLAVLMARGMVVRGVAGLGLGLATFVLFRASHVAAHGRLLFESGPVGSWLTVPAALELLRYGSYVLPLWVVLAAEGWRGLGVSHQRILAALVCLLPAIPSLAPMEDGLAPWSRHGAVDRDATRAVRALVDVSRAFPGRWITARLRPEGEEERWIGWRLPDPGDRDASAGVWPVLEDRPPAPQPGSRTPSLRWEGLGCAVPGRPCPAPPEGTSLGAWTFSARPHIASAHGIPTTDSVTLRLWWIGTPPPVIDGGEDPPSG